MFTPSFTPRGEHSLLFRRMEGQTENFTPGEIFAPRGQNLPLGDNFAPGVKVCPRGKVKNGPLFSMSILVRVIKTLG
jgi:hypothetical protein